MMEDDFIALNRRAQEIKDELDDAIRLAKKKLDQMCEEYSHGDSEQYKDTHVQHWVLSIGMVRFNEYNQPEFPVIALAPTHQPDYVSRGLIAESDMQIEAGCLAYYTEED